MRCVISILILLLSQSAFANVSINELLASNIRAVPDIVDFEDYPDFIELKNNGDSAVNLDGYFLSDSPSNPFRWQIPSGATIPPHGFLLIMADGHDAAPGQNFPRGYWPWHNFTAERYHANFSLSAAGETVILSEATGLGTAILINAANPATVPPATVAVWKYKDNGSDQGTAWKGPAFDDSTWPSGRAKLGYGDSAATTVSYGPSSNNKYITTYFRHRFNITDPAAYHSLRLRLLVDDGCVVYLNGTEVLRQNMPEGGINYKTTALNAIGGADETTYSTYNLPASALAAGDNVVAVEVHQDAANSSDIGFDLGLTASSHNGYNLIDAVTYSQQVPDISYGRDSTNSSVWKQFAEPTPGAENFAFTVDNIRVKGNSVSFSLPGGLYPSDQTVALSSPAGVIHYTLDGSNPTSRSPVYSGPIEITSTTVVRARAYEFGKAPGPIATRTYFRNETQTNVPYVSLVADPETLFGNEIGIYRNQHEPIDGSYGLHDVYKGKDAPGNVEFFAPDRSGFSAGCGIRIGGENNWVHPQKALNVTIQGKYGEDSVTYDLFPGSQIPVHSAFTLRDGGDNWDRDMLRDALIPKLAHGYLNVDTADYRPSVVFINGEYFGIHNIRQRWDETWFAQQYHVPADRIDHLLYGHITSPSTTLGVDKGSTADWLDLLNFLNTADLTSATNWAFVESRMDIDSFMDFIITESYANNTAWHHNREFWKEKGPGAKWRWFLTDMDRTFSTSSLTGILADMLSTDEVLVRLKTNPEFRRRLGQRYAAHMAATFKPSRVQAIISQMDSEVSSFVPRHAARWAPNGTTVARRSSAIQEIKTYAADRANNFAAEISSDLGLGAAVDLTLAVNAAEGSVLVEGVPVSAGTFKMFPNALFTLKAVSAPGYAFGGWSGAQGGETISVTLTAAKTITANFVRSGETVIGGTLQTNTTLALATSPYALDSDLIVSPGLTLTIEAGVTINVPARQNIRVQGILNVTGTASKPVLIQGRSGARWGAISFENSTSTLAHLILRGATAGFDPTIYNSALSAYNSVLVMDFLTITECNSPVNCVGGSCTLRDSTLYNPYVGDSVHVRRGEGIVQRCIFPGNNAPDTDAIDFDGVLDGLIENCRIYRFQGLNSDGLDIGEGTRNLTIRGNMIYYNDDKGVSLGQGSSVILEKNLIVGCALGVGIKDTGSSAIIDQNTFVNCGTGVAVYEKNFGEGGGTAVISNTIISKATDAPVTVDSFSILSASYSLSDTLPLAGNSNLLADPRFVDPITLNFELQPTSPAINAGDPAHVPDSDNTRVDIGAHYQYTANDYPYTIGETVVINEVLANSGASSDWIELYNRTQSPIDIGGWFLSDSGTNLLKYRIPVGTVIPARGYLVFYENASFGTSSVDTNKVAGFALSDVGETVYVSSAANDQLTNYRTKEDFGPSTEGETLGRYYKPSSDSYNFIAMKTATPGAPNSLPRVGPIVISEIMYNPQGSGTGDAEYIELLNISTAPVTLLDSAKGKAWRVADGIEFEFPSVSPVTMSSGERIVLTKNLDVFTSTFGSIVPAGTRIFQWTAGSLDNGGETLQLDRPGAVDADNVQQYVRQDRVNYDDDLPWPSAADGHGLSLSRILEAEYGNDFSNWMAAAPSPGKSTAEPPADSDGDAMPDAWERNHFGNLSHDGTGDFDGDGVSDFAEYLAGTDPLNAEGELRLSLQMNAGTPVIHFTAESGRTYTVQYKSTLSDGAWLTLENVPAQTGTISVQINDPSVAGIERFYRVVTPAQP